MFYSLFFIHFGILLKLILDVANLVETNSILDTNFIEYCNDTFSLNDQRKEKIVWHQPPFTRGSQNPFPTIFDFYILSFREGQIRSFVFPFMGRSHLI